MQARGCVSSLRSPLPHGPHSLTTPSALAPQAIAAKLGLLGGAKRSDATNKPPMSPKRNWWRPTSGVSIHGLPDEVEVKELVHLDKSTYSKNVDKEAYSKNV